MSETEKLLADLKAELLPIFRPGIEGLEPGQKGDGVCGLATTEYH